MKAEYIYPKNKKHFLKLIEFAKKVISICNEEKIPAVIYGSFSHFYYTKDTNMKVNDIDLFIPRKGLKELQIILKNNKIRFTKCSPIDGSLIAKKGDLVIELDPVGNNYKSLNEKMLFNLNDFKLIDFYGQKAYMITLEQLEEIYSIALLESNLTKQKVIDRIAHFEKFLQRKIKKDFEIEIKKNSKLTNNEKNIINNNRVKEFGKNEIKDFKKDYEPDTLWFFLKRKGSIVALGGLRPIRVNHLGRKYFIRGICSIISIEKGKGYGKILITFMIHYSRTRGKTILGFTKKTEFFRKAGLHVKKGFIKRFIYKNPKTGEEIKDNDGDGIYLEGKDRFISKVLKSKWPVYITVPHW